MKLTADPYTLPDFGRSALLTIDVQKDFTLPGAPAHIPGTMEVLPSIARVVRSYRAARRPVVHVVRLYRKDGSNADLCRRSLIEGGKVIVAPGTEGSELMGDLKPDPSVRLVPDVLLAGHFQPVGPAEWIMYKPRWGAFYGTFLERQLKDLGAHTVVICGCNFPNCPRSTIYEASERDFRIAAVKDAISGIRERDLGELAGIGVRLVTAEECLAALL